MPHHLGDIRTNAHTAIVTGDPDRVPVLAEAIGVPVATWAKRGFVCTQTDHRGAAVLLASTGIGGPGTAIVAEELWQLGVGQIVRVGTCGAMQSHVRPGSLVVSSGAVRDDGTSHQHLPPSVPAVPDPALLASLVAELRARGIAHHIGLNHSKDAYYAEKTEGIPLRDEWETKWLLLRSIGVPATEMEAATLFAVATVRRFQAAALFVPVDHTISAGEVLGALSSAAVAVVVGALAIRAASAHPLEEGTQ